jgi:hypothetical protein
LALEGIWPLRVHHAVPSRPLNRPVDKGDLFVGDCKSSAEQRFLGLSAHTLLRVYA